MSSYVRAARSSRVTSFYELLGRLGGGEPRERVVHRSTYEPEGGTPLDQAPGEAWSVSYDARPSSVERTVGSPRSISRKAGLTKPKSVTAT